MCLKRESDTLHAGQGTCISALSHHAQCCVDSGTQWAFLSRVVLDVLHAGQQLLSREEYVHFWWRGSTAGKYCAGFDADGTP